MGSVIKKRRKRMAKKKHRKLLRKTRVPSTVSSPLTWCRPGFHWDEPSSSEPTSAAP